MMLKLDIRTIRKNDLKGELCTGYSLRLGNAAIVVFVDDGSHDRSPQMLSDLCQGEPRFKLLALSRNFGHQAAITAGLDIALGEAVVVMDSDLQDPPEVVVEMLDGLMQVVWGTSTRTMASPVGGTVPVLGQRMSVFIFVAAALATAVSAGIWALLRWTGIGTVLRGASQNASMAELLGVNTTALMTGLFAASAGVAALIGGFAGPIFSVRPGMDLDFLISAFLAVVIGGLGSVRGAIAGAYLVALASNLSLTFMTGDVATAVSFVVVIVILLARPSGIFREGRAIT